MNQNGELVSPYGSIGYRWGETGRWNLENKEGQHNGDVDLTLSLKGSGETASVGLDYFGGDEHPILPLPLVMPFSIKHSLPYHQSCQWTNRQSRHRF